MHKHIGLSLIVLVVKPNSLHSFAACHLAGQLIDIKLLRLTLTVTSVMFTGYSTVELS